MASIAVTAGQGAQKSTSAAVTPPRLVRLWRDTTRVEQMVRLRALELQPGDDFGQRAWELANQHWRQLPDEARVDLPTPRVFARILGLMRTGATLKTGKLLRLEISAQEIAELVGYSKSTVEAALRWLGSGPIEYQGDQLARGLGIIHRGRRTAWAFLDGVRRRIYRTSRIVLTMFGRLVVGLGVDADKRKQQRRAEHRARNAKPTGAPAPSTPRREREHIEGQGTNGPPVPESTPAPSSDVGMAWLKNVLSHLNPPHLSHRPQPLRDDPHSATRNRPRMLDRVKGKPLRGPADP